MARKKIKDIFAADNTQSADATQASTPPVEKESRRQKKKRQANMTQEQILAESDRELFGDKLEPNLSRNSVPDVIPEGEPKSDRYKTVISKGPEKERVVTRTKEEEGTGNALLGVVNNNTSVTTGGDLMDKAIADNPDMTFSETQELAGKLSEVDKVKPEVDDDVNQAIGAKVNEAVSTAINKGVVAGAGEDLVEEGGDMEQGGANVPNAQSQALMGIGGGGSPEGTPEYEAVADKDKVQRDIAQANQMAAGRDEYVPQAVVQQLGVQDYFPTMSRDIAKGTWTGSVLGSQTIYAGGGAVLPMGLYDARKRALNEAAKEKQAKIDKLLELPNTADQFNTRYQDYGYEFINSELERFGSYSAMAADPEFRRKMAQFKNIGKDIAYVDRWADGKIEDLNKGKWIPLDVKEKLYDFKSGILENFDGIMSGDKRASELVGYLRSYENGISWIDENADTWFSKDMMDETPIGVNKKAIEKDPEGYNQFIQAVEDGSIDNDSYVTGARTFLDLSKIEPRIDNWIRGNNADPETKETLVQYLTSLIPKKDVLEFHSMGNDATERRGQDLAQKRWAAEFEQRKKENETYYQYMNRQMSSADMNNDIMAIKNNKSLSPKQKIFELKKIGDKYGIGTPNIDKYSGAIVFTRRPSDKMTSEPRSTKDGNKIQLQEYNPATGKWDKKVEMTFAEYKGLNEKRIKYGGKNRYLHPNGAPVTVKEVKEIRSAASTQLGVTSLNATKGIWNDRTKSWETMTEKNFNNYDPNNSINIERLEGKVQIPIRDTKTGQITYKTTNLHMVDSNNMNTQGGSTSLDSYYGATGSNLKGNVPQNSSTSSSTTTYW